MTGAVAAALSGGWLWAASGQLLSIGSWTVLTLHAWIGLALVPLVLVHLLPRRWRLLRPGPSVAGRGVSRLMSRRALLVGGGLAMAGLATSGLALGVERLRGGERRFTGSRWLPFGTVPPATTFFGEAPPPVDAAAWQVDVRGRVGRPRSFTVPALAALGETDLVAVLD